MSQDASVQLGRVSLTKVQLKAAEIALYRAADVIDRLLADGGVQYTKIAVPAGSVPIQQPPQPVPPLKPEGWQFGGQTALTQRPDTRGGV